MAAHRDQGAEMVPPPGKENDLGPEPQAFPYQPPHQETSQA